MLSTHRGPVLKRSVLSRPSVLDCFAQVPAGEFLHAPRRGPFRPQRLVHDVRAYPQTPAVPSGQDLRHQQVLVRNPGIMYWHDGLDNEQSRGRTKRRRQRENRPFVNTENWTPGLAQVVRMLALRIPEIRVPVTPHKLGLNTRLQVVWTDWPPLEYPTVFILPRSLPVSLARYPVVLFVRWTVDSTRDVMMWRTWMSRNLL